MAHNGRIYAFDADLNAEKPSCGPCMLALMLLSHLKSMHASLAVALLGHILLYKFCMSCNIKKTLMFNDECYRFTGRLCNACGL